jgi:ring-1,2-phenylacetyl-CoA epoxidase subunit PaaE
MATAIPDKLHVIHIHSQPADEWNGIRGRINNTRLEQLVNKSLRYDRLDARFFICGPFDLMRAAEITLHFMGFSDDQIRKENFVIAAPPPPPPVSYPHEITLITAENLLNCWYPRTPPYWMRHWPQAYSYRTVARVGAALPARAFAREGPYI